MFQSGGFTIILDVHVATNLVGGGWGNVGGCETWIISVKFTTLHAPSLSLSSCQFFWRPYFSWFYPPFLSMSNPSIHQPFSFSLFNLSIQQSLCSLLSNTLDVTIITTPTLFCRSSTKVWCLSVQSFKALVQVTGCTSSQYIFYFIFTIDPKEMVTMD